MYIPRNLSSEYVAEIWNQNEGLKIQQAYSHKGVMAVMVKLYTPFMC
jgi:hypothetical protein